MSLILYFKTNGITPGLNVGVKYANILFDYSAKVNILLVFTHALQLNLNLSY